MKRLAAHVSFIELHPGLPSYSYMFMLEAITYKVNTVMHIHDMTQRMTYRIEIMDTGTG